MSLWASVKAGGMKKLLAANAVCSACGNEARYSDVTGDAPSSSFTLGTVIAGSVARLAFSLIFGAATSSPSDFFEAFPESSSEGGDFPGLVGLVGAASSVIASAPAGHSSSSPAEQKSRM